MSKIIISWGHGTQRSTSIASILGIDDIHIPYPYLSKYLKPLNYIVTSVKTLLMLLKTRPKSIIIAVPPTILVYSVFAYKLFNRNVNIIIDCHNGVLRKEWKSLPFLKLLFNKSHNVISHNSYVKPYIDKTFNIETYVLGDPILKPKIHENKNYSNYIIPEKVNILVPVSYAEDEPIDEIILAASEIHENYNFILTGRYTKFFNSNYKPPGITFTGFITYNEYANLLNCVDICLCLTLDEKIQMCALIESISMSKIIVCSDNPVNRLNFNDYNLFFTDNTSKSILESISNINKSKIEINIDFVKNYNSKWLISAKEIFYD